MNAALCNGPMTYELDGKQYLVAGAGDTLYTFALLNQTAGESR
jgi:alcohol dehydrogenase (cytochrome c)